MELVLHAPDHLLSLLLLLVEEVLPLHPQESLLPPDLNLAIDDGAVRLDPLEVLVQEKLSPPRLVPVLEI